MVLCFSVEEPPQWLLPVFIPPSGIGGSRLSRPSPPMTICSLSDEAHFEWWEVIPHLVLICIHLIMHYGEELCMWVFPNLSTMDLLKFASWKPTLFPGSIQLPTPRLFLKAGVIYSPSGLISIKLLWEMATGSKLFLFQLWFQHHSLPERLVPRLSVRAEYA